MEHGVITMEIKELLASNALTSTTASDGFLICDTDSANHYAYGQPSGSTYQYIESLVTTNAIDLSAHSAVSLNLNIFLDIII